MTPEPDASPGRRAPDLLTILSLLLLLVLAALLLWPLLGGQAPSPYLIGVLLLARLGIRVAQAQKDERLKRPASWALDLLLIGLMFYVASTQ